MLWTSYRSLPAAAISGRFLIVVAMLLLAGCEATVPKVGQSPYRPQMRTMAPAPQSAAEIEVLMEQARNRKMVGVALAGLDRLIVEAEPVMASEAMYRKAQLMLENSLTGAEQATLRALQTYPKHPLVPYAHFWLARWWAVQGDADQAIAELDKSLRSPMLTRELADDVFAIGPGLTPNASERNAVNWLLAAARIDQVGRDSWLRMAARRASMPTIEALHQQPVFSRELLPLFDIHAGRSHLMIGDVRGVGHIADLLAQVMPGNANIRQLRAWAGGENRAATVGVMLPLTGTYGRYGQEALRGIRIALASLESEGFITLRVEDTASTAEGAVVAYKQLAAESVNIIVGPLLADATEAILPYLHTDLPVISLTGRTDLALKSRALFVHTLSPLAQVYVMADYAWQHDARRIVVISAAGENQTESQMMTTSFESLGGEVMQNIELEAGVFDHRDQLRRLRYETDDDAEFIQLDEELNVFLPEMDMEIRIKPNFDAVYLAMDGKQVSLIAGQLAYADIVDVPIYGSSRWQDGHLLDDRGRYLSRARFAASSANNDESPVSDEPAERQFLSMYRETWGNKRPSPLMRLAYDSMRIASVMTSQLGYSRYQVIDGLHDPGGFPALTGHVRFDKEGVGQKQLDVFGIKRGKVVPAG